jgi:hypothetical protein
LAPGEIVAATVYAGLQGLTQYWVDYTQPHPGKPTQLDYFAYSVYYSNSSKGLGTGVNNFEIPTNNKAAPAFQILATIINVDAAYATSQLNVNLTDPLEIDYPVAVGASEFNCADPKNLHIDLDTTAGSQNPNTAVYDTIGHEFGHYVSYESNSFYTAGGAQHSVGFNQRFFNGTTGATNRVNFDATLTYSDLATPSQEGWADYFDVCAKDWYITQAGVKHNNSGYAALVDIQAADPTQFYWSNNQFISLRQPGIPKPVAGNSTPISRGEDEEGSIARILWGLAHGFTVPGGQPVAGIGEKNLFNALVSGKSPIGASIAKPFAVTTLDGLAEEFGLFNTIALAQQYGWLQRHGPLL